MILKYNGLGETTCTCFLTPKSWHLKKKVATEERAVNGEVEMADTVRQLKQLQCRMRKRGQMGGWMGQGFGVVQCV